MAPKLPHSHKQGHKHFISLLPSPPFNYIRISVTKELGEVEHRTQTKVLE